MYGWHEKGIDQINYIMCLEGQGNLYIYVLIISIDRDGSRIWCWGDEIRRTIIIVSYVYGKYDAGKLR